MTRPRIRPAEEAGMVTSEYAVGTVGACGVAGILIALTQTDWFDIFIMNLLDQTRNFPYFGLM